MWIVRERQRLVARLIGIGVALSAWIAERSEGAPLLYVASQGTNNIVFQVDGAGQASAFASVSEPAGVAVDAAGDVFVASSSAGGRWWR